MDAKSFIGLFLPSLIRGIMWLLTGYLGMEATQAKETSAQLAQVIAAIVVALVSLWWSGRDKQKALDTPVPEK